MYLSLVLIVIGFTACDDQQAEPAVNATQAPVLATVQPVRWYDRTQVEWGDGLFQTHCSECHKPDASGTSDWRTPLASGKYPPPPLDGTAHTWHHPLTVLRRTVRIGGVPLGGTMPGFADKLTSEQIDAILAWVQSHWPDEIYRIWHERNMQANERLQSQKG